MWGEWSTKGIHISNSKSLILKAFFGIKVTLMGSSLFLSESHDEKDLTKYINREVDWVGEWFDEITS